MASGEKIRYPAVEALGKFTKVASFVGGLALSALGLGKFKE